MKKRKRASTPPGRMMPSAISCSISAGVSVLSALVVRRSDTLIWKKSIERLNGPSSYTAPIAMFTDFSAVSDSPPKFIASGEVDGIVPLFVRSMIAGS